jgi:glucokinase
MVPEDVVLAVDVGGTDTKSALARLPGGAGKIRLEDIRRTATARPADPDQTSSTAAGEAVVSQISRLEVEYSRAWPQRRIRAVGVIVPGLVDEERGIGLLSANLGWRNFPFAARISEATSLPVFFGHDVGVAGEAEVRLGAAQGRQDAVVLIIGTGIAGAVFSDGTRIQGGGYAGEVGHARVPNGEQCACGAYGCLESVGSAGAIVRRYARLSGRQPAGAREVLALAASGEAAAQQILDDAVAAIGFSIGQAAALLGTGTVVIGGGLAQAGAQLLEPLERAVDAQLSFHRRPELLPAELGQDAGLIGASLRAWDLHFGRMPGARTAIGGPA